MEIAGRGRILIWEGASLWLMEALPAPDGSAKMTDFHSHHAIQVTLSLGGRVELRTRDRAITGDAVVAPDVEHLLEAVGQGAVLFVQPESRFGRAIAQAIVGDAPLKSIPEGMLTDLVERLTNAYCRSPADEKALEHIGRLLVERLAGR